MPICHTVSGTQDFYDIRMRQQDNDTKTGCISHPEGTFVAAPALTAAALPTRTFVAALALIGAVFHTRDSRDSQGDERLPPQPPHTIGRWWQGSPAGQKNQPGSEPSRDRVS